MAELACVRASWRKHLEGRERRARAIDRRSNASALSAPRLAFVPGDPDLPFTGGELTLGARVLSAARKILRRPQPVDILRYRERMRNEIREKLEWPDRGVPEVLVVRLSKKDVFPSTDSLLYGLFRVSPWFKLEAKAVHDRGFEVTLKIDRVSIKRRKARTALGDDDAATRKVWVVGRIPYERIAHIDWDPDPVYSSPRLYVGYGWRGPFSEIVLYERWSDDRPMPRPYSDLFEIHDVKYQGESGNPWRWVRYTASRLSFSIRTRRQERRDRKEFPP